MGSGGCISGVDAQSRNLKSFPHRQKSSSKLSSVKVSLGTRQDGSLRHTPKNWFERNSGSSRRYSQVLTEAESEILVAFSSKRLKRTTQSELRRGFPLARPRAPAVCRKLRANFQRRRQTT